LLAAARPDRSINESPERARMVAEALLSGEATRADLAAQKALTNRHKVKNPDLLY